MSVQRYSACTNKKDYQVYNKNFKVQNISLGGDENKKLVNRASTFILLLSTFTNG